MVQNLSSCLVLKFFINYVRDVLDVLGSDYVKLPKFVAMFVVLSAVDLIGLGLIAPFIAATLDPDAMPEQIKALSSWFLKNPEPSDYLLASGMLLVIVFVVKMFLAIGIQRAIIGFGEVQKTRLRLTLLENYQAMDYQVFQSRNASDYTFMVQDVTVRFARIVVNLLKAVSDLFLCFCIFVFLLFYDVETVAILLLTSLFMVALYDRVFRNALNRRGAESNQTGIAVINALKESIGGLKEIRVLGREDYFAAEMRRNAEHYAESYTVVQTIGVIPRYTFESAAIIFIVTIVAIAVTREQEMLSYLPTLGVFALAVVRIIPPISQVASTFSNMHFNVDALVRLKNDISLTASPEALPNALGRPNPVATFEKLELRNVSFSYNGSETPALTDISMYVKKGEAIGIIGQSGSGKSTAMDLMLGLLTPTGGQILINGNLVDQESSWKNIAAYIPQESLITSKSLAENVALGESLADIDLERVRNCLQKASLGALAETLPKGLETPLGDSGSRLSGGQRQRVLLARALYHKREIIFLDEATSALDEKIEREIMEELGARKGELTFVLIAHRLNTLKFCDRIYKLDDSRVAKVGSSSQIISEEALG